MLPSGEKRDSVLLFLIPMEILTTAITADIYVSTVFGVIYGCFCLII